MCKSKGLCFVRCYTVHVHVDWAHSRHIYIHSTCRWADSHELLIDFKLTRNNIQRMVTEANVALRYVLGMSNT